MFKVEIFLLNDFVGPAAEIEAVYLTGHGVESCPHFTKFQHSV